MSTEYYTVEKKENDITIHSAMEIHMEIHIYQKFHHFILMPFFEKCAPPLTLSQVQYFSQISGSK